MKKFLATVAIVAAFTAGALAMPGDQAKAVQLAGEAPLDLDFGPLNLDLGALVAAEAPPALESAMSYEQYLAMPHEAQEALVESYYGRLPRDLEGLSDDERVMLAIKLGAAGPWEWIKCKSCQKGIGFFVGQVTKFGCVKVSVFAGAVCNIAGLGPANPLTSACIGAVIVACPIIAKQIAMRVTDPTRLCNAIKWC